MSRRLVEILTVLTLSPPNESSSAKFSSASIFKVLLCGLNFCENIARVSNSLDPGELGGLRFKLEQQVFLF